MKNLHNEAKQRDTVSCTVFKAEPFVLDNEFNYHRVKLNTKCQPKLY